MRHAALALVSVCALAACNPSAPGGGGAAFPNLASASYRAEATAYSDDGETIPIVMIRSGDKLRMEVQSAEGEFAMINNGESGESFVLMTQGGRTMAMQASATNFTNPTEAWTANFGSVATRTGSCSVAGETGSEWTQQDEDGSSTACVTDDGIILRGAEDGRVTWETTSVQRGPQSDDLFVLPPGVAVMDATAIAGQALQGLGGQAGADAGALNQSVCDTLRNQGAPPSVIAQAGC